MITDKQRENLKNMYVWIEQSRRGSNMYHAWMVDLREKWDVPGYITDCYLRGEECLKELTDKYGEEIVKEMNVVIHTPEMKNKRPLKK